jgi:hypothetical protein
MDDLTNETVDEYFKEKERKKKYLKRYEKNRACVSRLESKLELIESKLNSIKSTNYSDLPKGGLHKGMDDWVAEKIDLKKRIDKLNKRGDTLREETYDIIDTIMEPKLVEIMEYLFIKCYEMEDVADMLGLSKRQVLRRYRDAIDAIEVDKEVE